MERSQRNGPLSAFLVRHEAGSAEKITGCLCQHFQKSAAIAGTWIRENFGKEPKLLSNEDSWHFSPKCQNHNHQSVTGDTPLLEGIKQWLGKEVLNGGRKSYRQMWDFQKSPTPGVMQAPQLPFVIISLYTLLLFKKIRVTREPPKYSDQQPTHL